MKIQYTSDSEEEVRNKLVERYRKAISSSTGSAVLFSRSPRLNELVAVVPEAKSHNGEKIYRVVWLSGTEGSYISSQTYFLDEVAQVMVDGVWSHQPNAEILLESYHCDKN